MPDAMRPDAMRDVVLSSRVRLARNHQDIPFPSAMSAARAEESIRRAADAVGSPEAFALLRLSELPETRRRALFERHLISARLLSDYAQTAVLVRRDEALCVQLNDEDHLRIQALLPGHSLKGAAAEAFALDDRLGEALAFAFDAELGYLTSNPTNTGTGLRASALLHLPSLTYAGQLGALAQELAKLGLSIRGVYGKGSEARGDLYQISNQVTLGRTEQEIIDSLDALIGQIVDRERDAREALLLEDQAALEDRALRSVGILRYARRVDEAEFMRRWSDARLAVQAGLLSLDLPALDALLIAAQPAHIALAGQGVSEDEARANLARETLGGR